MLKVMMLLLSFMNFLMETKNELFDLVYSYNETIQKEDEILDYNNGFYLKKEEGNYVIFNENINFTFQKFPIYNVVDSFLYVTIYDEVNVYLYCYELTGELLYENIISLDVENIIDIFVFNNKVYCAGNVRGLKGKDGKIYNDNTVVIIDFLEENYILLGSEYYEELIDIECDDKLYLIIYKDKITNGDFGNGGKFEKNLCISLLDSDINIVNTTVYDIDLVNENKVNLYIRKNYILLETNTYLYKFNKELKYLDKIKLNDVNVIGDSLVCMLDSDNVYLYDIYTFNEVIAVDNTLDNEKLKVYHKQIIMKDNGYYNVDVVDYRLFRGFETYYEKVDDKNTVYTLFGKAELINEECDNYFDRQTVGIYNFELTYKSVNGLIFMKNITQDVKLDVNVVDGMVYPAGYRIRFNGNGKLNDESVVSNYPVYTPGDYQLYITGSSFKKTICFKIEEGSCEFNDEIYNYNDYLVYTGDEVIIELLDEGEKEYEVIDVISNYKIKEVSLKQNTEKNNIYINYGVLDKGKHFIYIEKIIVLYLDEEIEIIINKSFNVLVHDKVNDYELSSFDGENLKVIVNSFDNSIRAIEVIVTTNNISESYYFLIDTNVNSIDLLNLKEGITNLEVNIIYYTGYNYNATKICDINVCDYNMMETIGCVYKNNNDEDNNRITIDFSEGKDVVDKISIDNKLVYCKPSKIDYKVVVIGVVIGISCFIFLIIKRKKRKLQLDK